MAGPVAFTGFLGIGTTIVGGVLQEPTDVAYARQSVVLGTLPSGASGNLNIAAFTPQVTTWGQIGAIALFSAAGAQLYTATLTTPAASPVGVQIAALPGTITLTDPGNGTALLLAGSITAWSAIPARTVTPVPGQGIVRVGAPYEVTTAMLYNRDPSSTTDDTVDLTNYLAAGDVLTSASLISLDSTIQTLWTAWQGTQATARRDGGAPGVTSAGHLLWTSASGASGNAAVDQYTNTIPGGQALPDQFSALQVEVQNLSASVIAAGGNATTGIASASAAAAAAATSQQLAQTSANAALAAQALAATAQQVVTGGGLPDVDVSVNNFQVTRASHQGVELTVLPGGNLIFDYAVLGAGFFCLVWNNSGADISPAVVNFTDSYLHNQAGLSMIKAGAWVSCKVNISNSGAAIQLLCG